MEWKGTKGKVNVEPWYSHSNTHYRLIPNATETNREAEANAKLFTDALHTIQECGLMPSQLKDERDEYLIKSQDLEIELDHITFQRNDLEEENAKLKEALKHLLDYGDMLPPNYEEIKQLLTH